MQISPNCTDNLRNIHNPLPLHAWLKRVAVDLTQKNKKNKRIYCPSSVHGVIIFLIYWRIPLTLLQKQNLLRNLRKIKPTLYFSIRTLFSWRKMQEFMWIILKKKIKEKYHDDNYGLPRSPCSELCHGETGRSCLNNKILNCHVVPQLSWASIFCVNRRD